MTKFAAESWTAQSLEKKRFPFRHGEKRCTTDTRFFGRCIVTCPQKNWKRRWLDWKSVWQNAKKTGMRRGENHLFSCPFGALQYLLYSAYLPILQHDLDAVGMCTAIGQ